MSSASVLNPTPHYYSGTPGVIASYSSLTLLVPQPFVHTVVPQVKIPKLSIKKFSGDLTKWVTFWDSFNSAIHSNPSLSSMNKFNYLMSLVDSSAA